VFAVKSKRFKVLLVNPYIYDVAAYGFWSAPLGLLYIGSILRENGMKVSLLDCLTEQEGKRKEDGRAPFVKEKVDSPRAARGLGKRFRRYGMSRDEVASRLAGIEHPDLILVTCAMTYWYLGAAEMVEMLRKAFPDSRIVVGGTYAALCEEHAVRVMKGADLVVGATGGLDRFYTLLEEMKGESLSFRPGYDDITNFPYAAFDLYQKRPYVPLLTSVGCLYGCAYCATPYLRQRIVRRQPKSVLRELMYWNEKEISRFALYDDAFLAYASDYAKPLLTGIARLPFDVSFYNPNALNAALIDHELAGLLRSARFQEVRLGLETANETFQRRTGGKVNRDSFERAVDLLKEAGFSRQSIQAYVLAGLPGQRWEEVKNTIDYAARIGVTVHLAQYTPIPHTRLFQEWQHLARYPIAEEPLFQNNALFPFAWEGFEEEDMNALKAYARERNGEDAC
jgi:radical SAM superfamily enzyme YgiQ (UPF0313 family)